MKAMGRYLPMNVTPVIEQGSGIGGRCGPTVCREKGYRFFFLSREEKRPHIHVSGPDGEAKFWLEPELAPARSHRLSQEQLKEIEKIIEGRYHELTSAWEKHFSD